MAMRTACVLSAAALCACVPVRQTYYEAVGGKVTPQETLSKCRPDHFSVGKWPGSSLLVYAIPKAGKAAIAIDLYSGQSIGVDFEPREIFVESIARPQLHTTYPLKFVARCNPRSSAVSCESAGDVVEPPVQWKEARLPPVIYYEQVLPSEYAAGFTIRLPKIIDGTSDTGSTTATFKSVTEVVSTGPFGCMGP